MASSDEAILRAIAGKSNVRREPGYFRGMDGNRAIVDFGDGRVPADMGMDSIPPVNTPVWILLIDNRDPLVTGQSVPNPGKGTVSSVDSDSAIVSTDLGDYEVNMLALVNEGDDVVLIWNEDGGWILGTRVTSKPAPVDPGPPGGGTATHTQEFQANQSGSWRDGRYWTPVVRAGDTNLGVWAGGTKIRDTIPANATIQSVEVFLSPDSYGVHYAPPNIALHSLASLSGAPSFGPQVAVPVPPGGGYAPLPTSWGDLLKAGGPFLWVGINHGGDSHFNSVNSDGRSGQIRIRYTA